MSEEDDEKKEVCPECGSELKKEEDSDPSGLSKGARKEFVDRLISFIHPGY